MERGERKDSHRPKLIAFDVDGTLVETGHTLSPEFASLFRALVESGMQIAILSGRSLSEIHRVTDQLALDDSFHKKFFALSLCGTAFHEYEFLSTHEWREVYMHTLPDEEQRVIEGALHAHIFGTHFISLDGTYDRHIQNRLAQVSFVAFGAEAPLAEKLAWDPNAEKRASIKLRLEELLPDHAVAIGGLGSIDITRKGMDKGFGIRELARHTGIAEEDITFVGDMLFPGGNDYPVLSTGARAISVASPEETLQFVRELVGEVS